MENLQLIAEVQVGGGFIQHENRGVLHQGSGNHHQLPFAAGKTVKATVLQVGDADFIESPVTPIHILLLGGAEGGQAAGSSHKNNIKDTVVEGGIAGLGNVGDVPCGLPDGKAAGVPSVDEHLSGIPGEQPQNASEQGAFAHAVGSQNAHQLPFVDLEADVIQHLPGAVGKIEVFHFNAHSDPPFR